uniref:Uncharacterized protein n=1 Tax=Rhizophora mucronata TaxID=61149 RepID=A0A2P2IRW7_RHIMU
MYSLMHLVSMIFASFFLEYNILSLHSLAHKYQNRLIIIEIMTFK